MKTLFFSYDGRLNRGAFWKAHFILLGLWIVVFAISGLLAVPLSGTADTTAHDVAKVVLGLAILGLWVGGFVASIWAGVCLGIKRYHDHDKPGVWVCIQFVPVIGGMWYFVEAFCLDGTHGPNAFGADPLGRPPYVPYVQPVTTPAATWPAPALSQGPQPPQVAYATRPPSGRPGWVMPVMFVMLVPPALALVAGLVLTARSAMWLNGAVRVDGVVASLKPGEANDKGRMQYYPVVEATTADGKTIQVTSGWSSYPPADIGSKMEIAYPPGKPDDARVVAFADFWLLPIIFDSFAVIVFGWLLVMLIVKLAWKRAPRSAPPSALAQVG